MTIKMLAFDLDGVLLDSKRTHYIALNKALAEHGYNISPEEQSSRYEGLPTAVKLKMLSEDKGLPESLYNAIGAAKQRYTAQALADSIQPNITLHKAFKALKAQGYLIVLCSNSIRATVDIFLKKSGLSQYFDTSFSNEDVDKAKPDPQIYLLAMEQLGVKPDETLIFEDSPNGLKAAKDSGAHVAVVNSPVDVDLEFINGALARAILPNAG